MSKSPRRLLVGLLLTAGLAACGSPTTSGTPPTAQSPSSSSDPVPASSAPPVESATVSPTPSASTASAPTADRALPLTLTRTGGIAGVQDQVKVNSDGTATVTRRGGGPTKTTLSAGDLAALRKLLTDPALAREAKAGHGGGVCADGFKYTLRTPSLTMTMDDCGRSKHPLLTKVISLVLPPGSKGA